MVAPAAALGGGVAEPDRDGRKAASNIVEIVKLSRV